MNVIRSLARRPGALLAMIRLRPTLRGVPPLSLGLVVLAAAGLAAAAAPAAAAPSAQAEQPSYVYRLVDTWRDEPWQLRPGHFGLVSDISSAPDGTIYVLDGGHRALHILAADGTPVAVFPLPNITGDPSVIGDWMPRRLDVGFDGLPYVLLEGRYIDNNEVKTKARVDRLSTDVQRLGGFEVEAEKLVPAREGAYFDLALRRDGRVYLSRSAVNAFIIFAGCDPAPGETDIVDAGVDVFSPEGVHETTIDFHTHESVPFSLDMGADEVLHVVNAKPGVLGNPYCGPQPTAEPSGLRPRGDRAGASGLDQAVEEWPGGVAIFEPDHRLREIVPFTNAEDIAVGSAGVFVSRNLEIFQLRDGRPMYIGPTGGRVYAAYFGRIVHFLDVHVDGHVLAGFAHCFWQGVMIFEHPDRRQDVPKLFGMTDAPPLAGPGFPIRVDASQDLAVLQGRFSLLGAPPDYRYMATNQVTLPQTVQRWTRHGERLARSPLESQIGMCASGRTWFTRDLAIDGEAVYTVDQSELRRRADDFLPEWGANPGILTDPDLPSYLLAVDADAGRVATLDEGTRKVYVLGADGRQQADWAVGGSGDAVPVDLALSGERVYLADRGRNRVMIRGLDGSDLGEWPTHDGPVSIAAGPEGDLYILGRGRWGYRYAPDGRLLASWPMPDRKLWPMDIGVDVDGKVYISYIEPEDDPGIPSSPSYVVNAFEILQGGIWIFEGAPYVHEPVPPPDPLGCVATPDKWAAPRRIPLGDTVDVSLTVEGRCPGVQEAVQIALVFDTSLSMSWAEALDRARQAVSALLTELDPRTAEVALITFDNGATLEQPLTGDIAGVRALLAGLEATGDTRSTAGLRTAINELTGLRGKADRRRIVLLVSDGVLKDDPAAEAAAARAAGLEIYALVTPTGEYQATNRDQILLLTGSPDRVFTEPDATELVALARSLTNYRPEPGLFETITIRDEVPRNMRYIAGSARPAAGFDPTNNVLTWTLTNVAADQPITLSYTLEPLEIGIWPTNVVATADYRDAVGRSGRLIFPVPEVEVYGFPKPSYFAYLPFAAKGVCFPVEKPLDIVLVMDTSSSMREPAAGGTGTKLDAARAAAASFLANLSFGRDRAAIVSFNRAATRVVPLSGDPAELQAGLDALVSVEGTRIDLGLAEAVDTLFEGGRATAKPVVILLTDGLQNIQFAPNDAVLAQAERLKGMGSLVYSIGLGDTVDAALLQAAATSPDRFYRSPSDRELADIYAQIKERITCDLREPPLPQRSLR